MKKRERDRINQGMVIHAVSNPKVSEYPHNKTPLDSPGGERNQIGYPVKGIKAAQIHLEIGANPPTKTNPPPSPGKERNKKHQEITKLQSKEVLRMLLEHRRISTLPRQRRFDKKKKHMEETE